MSEQRMVRIRWWIERMEDTDVVRVDDNGDMEQTIQAIDDWVDDAARRCMDWGWEYVDE